MILQSSSVALSRFTAQPNTVTITCMFLFDHGKGLGECGITQECFEVGETAVTLGCGHVYKEESIVHWLGLSNTCPYCRQEVV